MADINGRRPRVLFVYYTHTNQARRVCESMAEVLRSRGCEVSEAGIEFTDPHYAKNFSTFPFKHAVFSILPVKVALPTQATVDRRDRPCR
jgi:hypothetical protein